MQRSTVGIIGYLLFVLVISGSPLAEAQAQEYVSEKKKKQRKREIEKFWKNEVRIARSKDHKSIALQYPEIGWLSGLWCKEGEKESYKHIEVLGDKKLRIATRGYTGVSINEVLILNWRYLDLWNFPEKHRGTKGTNWIYFSRFMRVKKGVDDKHAVVYATSFTVNDPDLDFENFKKEKSQEIIFAHFWEKSKYYSKCK